MEPEDKMAEAPTAKEVKELLRQSKEADEAKQKSQQEIGKDFIDNGQGVIPEDIWQNLPGKKETEE